MAWESVFSDLRLSLRQQKKAPLFAAMVIATLALGIGANSAIFSSVHAVLIKPLPYQEPNRLVAVWSHNTTLDDPNYPVSPANFDAFAREATSFTQVEGMYSFLTNLQIGSGDASETIQASWVTPVSCWASSRASWRLRWLNGCSSASLRVTRSRLSASADSCFSSPRRRRTPGASRDGYRSRDGTEGAVIRSSEVPKFRSPEVPKLRSPEVPEFGA